MNRNDSYWDHHHTTTRGFDETVNWHLKRAQIYASKLILGKDRGSRRKGAKNVDPLQAIVCIEMWLMIGWEAGEWANLRRSIATNSD